MPEPFTGSLVVIRKQSPNSERRSKWILATILRTGSWARRSSASVICQAPSPNMKNQHSSMMILYHSACSRPQRRKAGGSRHFEPDPRNRKRALCPRLFVCSDSSCAGAKRRSVAVASVVLRQTAARPELDPRRSGFAPAAWRPAFRSARREHRAGEGIQRVSHFEMKTGNFFSEQKRRNVYKVAIAYGVVA